MPRALKKTPNGSESRNPFAYLLPLAPIAEVAVSFIPVVGTAVALYAVYVAYSDPDATNEDRVFALVGIAPFGKITGLLAHSKIVVAATKVAEKGGAKAARGLVRCSATRNELRSSMAATPLTGSRRPVHPTYHEMEIASRSIGLRTSGSVNAWNSKRSSPGVNDGFPQENGSQAC